MATSKLTVLPEDRAILFERGESLSAVLRRGGIALNLPCGGMGRCGRCEVEFHGGAPEPTADEAVLVEEEALAEGRRLACRCRLETGATVLVPSWVRPVEPRILTTSGRAEVALDPAVRKVLVHPEPATVDRPAADQELVAEVLAAAGVEEPRATLACLRALPTALRARDHELTVTLREEELIDAEPGDATAEVYGVAVDLGTTTVAASLHSLRTGEELALAAQMNPQVGIGEDLISRLNHTFRNPEGLRDLQTTIAGLLSTLVRQLCRAAGGVDPRHVYEMTVAGNAAMNHLLLGVPPENIGLAPYTPVFRVASPVRASDLGLALNAEAKVVVLPNIGGFVGGDTVAGLLVADAVRSRETLLLIDIGTNCETVLVHDERMYAASAPAGPALEGACIEFGSRAGPGAIEDVEFAGGELAVSTIGDEPAKSLCGSGLLHAVAALRDAGALKPSGLFAPRSEMPESLRPRVTNGPDGQPRLLLAARAQGAERDVWLTQRDVREFQLARAAITSAWKTLCEEAGIDDERIERVFVAGAFGNYIRPEAAQGLGITPARAEVEFIGNAALEGARMVLLNQTARALALSLPSEVRFVELAGRMEFPELFALELALGA